MRCGCGGITEVKDSRLTTIRGEHTVRRRRRCLSCGATTVTLEVTVGNSKIAQTMMAAGRAANEAREAIGRFTRSVGDLGERLKVLERNEDERGRAETDSGRAETLRQAEGSDRT